MAGYVSEPQRIVLFGAQGQLGSRLLQALTFAGYEVTGIDRSRCDFSHASVRDIAVILRAVEPQLIINAAAYTAVDMAEREVAQAMRINAEIPAILAEIAQEQSIPFMHFSTDYVFDGKQTTPYVEDAATHPLNVYGQSKRAGELAVRAHGGYVFRLQWVYAGGGQNFFTRMAALLRTRDALRVVADQIGAPSHAAHIAQALVQAVPLMLVGDMAPSIYHLCADGCTSWHGFACAIAKAIGSKAQLQPITSAEYPLPALRPKEVRLGTSALAAHGIFMPHWREGIALAAKEAHADS